MKRRKVILIYPYLHRLWRILYACLYYFYVFFPGWFEEKITHGDIYRSRTWSLIFWAIMSAGPAVDKIEPFGKKSSLRKGKQKKSQGSSKYRTKNTVELQPLALLKGKLWRFQQCKQTLMGRNIMFLWSSHCLDLCWSDKAKLCNLLDAVVKISFKTWPAIMCPQHGISKDTRQLSVTVSIGCVEWWLPYALFHFVGTLTNMA